MNTGELSTWQADRARELFMRRATLNGWNEQCQRCNAIVTAGRSVCPRCNSDSIAVLPKLKECFNCGEKFQNC